MELEIEEKLEEIYRDFIDVKFKDFGIYDVYLTLKGGVMIAVVFKYDANLSFDYNIKNISNKIDSELLKLFKKSY